MGGDENLITPPENNHTQGMNTRNKPKQIKKEPGGDQGRARRSPGGTRKSPGKSQEEPREIKEESKRSMTTRNEPKETKFGLKAFLLP